MSAWTGLFTVIAVLDNTARHLSQKAGLTIRAACVGLIYRKLLKLSYGQGHHHLAVFNLISTDTQKIYQTCCEVHYVWIGPVQMVLASIFLCWLIDLGVYGLIGIGLIILLIPLQVYISHRLYHFRCELEVANDRRLRIIGEIITGIDTIKHNCWERSFRILVDRVRCLEVSLIKKINRGYSLMSGTGEVSVKLVLFVVFTALLYQPLTAGSLFTAMAIYGMLKESCGRLLPNGIQHYREAAVAVARIQKYLLLEEKKSLECSSMLKPCKNEGGLMNIEMTKMSPEARKTRLPDNLDVKVTGLTASWTNAENLDLEDISFTIQKESFVAVCGPHSSGKSSLLLSLLSEAPGMNGLIQHRGSLSYAAQQPWIFPGTVKDNILFGTRMDKKQYCKVLKACALNKEMNALTHGDLTYIGDRNTPLTLTQKVKICLARAVYQNADVYLLDCQLDAIDRKTANYIYTQCLCGILACKTVILITNNLDLLMNADQILLLNQGRLLHKGTFESLDVKCKMVLTYMAIDSELKPRHKIQSEAESHLGEDSVVMDLQETYTSQSSRSLQTSVGPSSKSLRTTVGHKERGACSSLWQYFSAIGGGGGTIFVLFLLLYIISQVLFILVDWYLYQWCQIKMMNDEGAGSNTTVILYKRTFSRLNRLLGLHYYVYAGLLGGTLFTCYLRVWCLGAVATTVSRKLHQKVFMSLLRAPIKVYHTFTFSDIISKFTKDICVLDSSLPIILMDLMQYCGLVLVTLLLSGAANYWSLLLLLLLLPLFLVLRHYYTILAKNLNTLEAKAHTSVYSHVVHSVEGMWTVRAHRAEQTFLRRFDAALDHQVSVSYLTLAARRWFSLRLDVILLLFVTVTGFLIIVIHQNVRSLDLGLVGLSLVYYMSYLQFFHHAANKVVDVQIQLSSVDNVMSLCDIAAEPHSRKPIRPPLLWPQYGIVTLEGVTIQGDLGVKLLKRVFCCFRAHEKVGILCNEKQSKHSFISILLRTAEIQGVVRIDGVDISELELQDLRESIAVIPDDPYLFSGGMRRNLDPYARHPDANIWKILEEVELREKIDSLPHKLYTDLGDLVCNFSLGERLRLALARALLKASRILLIQEPSDHVDVRSWNIIMNTIHSSFQRCTVLLLAEKLPSVINMDRVMIIDDGKIKEYDPPHLLLQNSESLLSKMCDSLDSEEHSIVRQLASDKYERQPYCEPRRAASIELGLPSNTTDTRTQNGHITGLPSASHYLL